MKPPIGYVIFNFQRMNLNDIIEAILENRVRITDHADEEAENDHLSFDEIYFSVLYGEIIENYPKEKPYPRYLIYGESFRGDPIHSVWSYVPSHKLAILITVYRPDANRWINWIKRRN